MSYITNYDMSKASTHGTYITDDIMSKAFGHGPSVCNDTMSKASGHDLYIYIRPCYSRVPRHGYMILISSCPELLTMVIKFCLARGTDYGYII